MKIISRKEAQALGLRRYYTGRACPYGHIAERYTNTCVCIECKNVRSVKWQKDNKTAQKLIAKKSAQKNKDKISKRNKKWYEKNKDYYVKRRLLNPEESRSSSKKYRQANPEKILTCNRKRRALQAEATGNHTAKDVEDIVKKQKYKCPSCFVSIKKKYHVDHILPLARGGTNDIKNIQCLCPTCNVRKQAQDPIVWANKNGRLL